MAGMFTYQQTWVLTGCFWPSEQASTAAWKSARRGYQCGDGARRSEESEVRTLELRISHMARNMPANSWAKIFAPARVCHQEWGSYWESGAATTRRIVPAGKVLSQM